MTTIKIQNIRSWLYSDDPKLKEILWKGLRFRSKNYFHNHLYKAKKWDGFEEFFDRKSGKFLTGLLPEIRYVADRLGIEYSVIDETNPFQFAIPSIDCDFLKQWSDISGKEITLHDYQVDYINSFIKVGRGLVFSPTGSGKSYVIVGLLKCLSSTTPTLIVTKSVDLTRQIYDDLSMWGFPNLGKVIGSKKSDYKPNMITVANIDSIRTKIDKLLPHFRALIVDEVHDMMSKGPKQLYQKMPNASVRIGLSATPFKYGSTDQCQKYEVKGYFGAVVQTQGRVITTKELQERGILAASNCTFYHIDKPSLPYHTYLDAVTEGLAESPHFNGVVAKLSKKLKGRVLIIVERIKQGELLQALIPKSVFVYGKDNEQARRECISLLSSSDNCVCIVQQKLISAGINVFIHHLVNAMGGKADHNIIQRMGRGLRTASDKGELQYWDFIFRNNDYLFDHSNHRVKVLQLEGHNVIIKDEIDF